MPFDNNLKRKINIKGPLFIYNHVPMWGSRLSQRPLQAFKIGPSLALVDFQATYRYIFRAEKTQSIRKRALFPENGGWQSIEKLL